MSNPPFELPEENRLELPATWRPSKPKRTAPEPPDPEALGRIRGWIEQRRGGIEGALAESHNEQYAGHIRAYLEGQADPLGAGATVAILKDHCESHEPGNIAVDAWWTEHGLTFAAAAVTELVSFYAGRARSHQIGRPYTYLSESKLYRRGVEHLRFESLRAEAPVVRMRNLIEHFDEDEYAAVREAIDAHRYEPIQRLVAVVLAPREADWVLDACAVYPPYRDATDGGLWSAITQPRQLAALPSAALTSYHFVVRLLGQLMENLGGDSLPALVATLDQEAGLKAQERQATLSAIAMLPTDEAMDYLLDHLDQTFVFASACEAVRRFPRRALRRIGVRSESAEGGTSMELAGLVAALEPEVKEAALKTLEESEREAIDGLFDSNARVPEARPDDLPRLLIEPPWSDGRPKPKLKTVKGLQAPAEVALAWEPGEREQWADIDVLRYRGLHHVNNAKRALAGPDEPPIAEVIASARSDRDVRSALLPVIGLETARLMAEWYSQLKTVRPLAASWFDRHRQKAAELLIPDAVGKQGKARTHAATALLYLSDRHGEKAVLEAAETYGPTAAQAIRQLLDVDPLEPIGVKVPAIGEWVNPMLLPQVLLKGRERAVPDASIRHLVTVLAIVTPDYDYRGLGVVAELCDRDSLTEFSHALFRRWLSTGAPTEDSWVLTQLAHFSDDETIRMLVPLIRAWPGENQHQRAVVGLTVLRAIGTEQALQAINQIAQRVKFKGLQYQAEEMVEEIAAELGLSADQLADRLVPDFGLADESTLVLDYGPRQFQVGFDEQLKPFVTDQDGKVRKALPKPGKSDDAEIAEASRKRFSSLKKELRAVAADQVRRLEQAMIDGRTWSRGEFTELLVEHPLVGHLTTRLVWMAGVGDDWRTFRVDEGRTFADIADEQISVPESARIRLAHPYFLERQNEGWGAILSDYEILQPFKQLSRPVLAMTEKELASGRLHRFEGHSAETGRFLGLTKSGWDRSTPMDAGGEAGLYYALPEGGYLNLELDPGITVGNTEMDDKHEIRAVYFSPRPIKWSLEEDLAAAPENLDPVLASELVWTLENLTGTD
ncbi:DUF4132 domain-containing protein [Glycomyces buryatensis]|uniref:DUF4132 domain-containing protein n=1 Tax=Glycomyces buryatensis TaxID=2570927 RepID=A0A4S8QBR7_9ACTN|nr:DUF4132 domain-containing protein [Glycomyces buryatensis]THV38499.1 DUF4132 domain-containing protein [Glycomyces buryatensis]